MVLANGLWETRVINLRDATVSPATNKQIQKIWIILDNDTVQLDNIAFQKEGIMEANFNNTTDLQSWQPGAWGAVNIKSITFDNTLNSNRLVATVPSGEYGSLRLDVPNLPADLFPYLRLKLKRENAAALGRILIAVKTTDAVNTYFSWTNVGGTNYNVINIPTEWSELKLNHQSATVNPTAGKTIDTIEIFYQGNQTLGTDDVRLWMHDKDPIIPSCNNPSPTPTPDSGSGTTQNNEDPEIAYLDQTLIAPYVYYHHPDHLGSSSLTTDENRHTVNSIRYYPYGSTRLESGTSASHYKFTDQEEDAETDLYYYGARYYDPVIGRFISNDPLQQNIGQMIQLGEMNGYRYVLNNPVKYVDPTGMHPLLIGAIYMLGGALAGAGIGAATDAGVQYLSSGEVDWGQTYNAALMGGVQGAITGPVGGLTSGVRSLTLRGGAILAADIAGGTVAEIAINGKSFSDAAFQSTITSLMGYGAGKMLGKINAKYGVGSVRAETYTRQMYQVMNGESLEVSGKEADSLWKGFLGDSYTSLKDNRGFMSADGERVVIMPHSDKYTPDAHMNFRDEGKGINAHVKINDIELIK